MLGAADRHAAEYVVEHAAQTFFIHIVGGKRQAAGEHAAADVDANGSGDDGRARGDHRADGGADAQMHVGHGGDMPMHDGQAGDID